MIIEKSETTVAYRCPSCGGGVLSPVGAFRLNADRLVLKCPCSKSEMSIQKSADSKIHITVPCFLCSAPHNYTISESLFFSQKLFMFPCHASGIDICFIGGQKDVSEALEENTERLRAMIEDAGLSEEDVFSSPEEEEPSIPDAHIYDIVNFLVRELEYDHKIECSCNAGPYGVYFSEDGESIIVLCEHCGARKEFAANSIAAANDFLNIDSITLE